jgi:uncharacterized membrane protein YozB (DUF420 family)
MHALLSLDGPPAANANLMLQLAMGIALLIGTWLARRQRYGWHQAFQTTVVVLQLVLIGLVMAPSFHTSRVLHGAWAHPGRPYFAVALAHALAGAVAAALGVYVVVSAGTRMLPAALRLRSYKPWMRTTLALWLVALGLGVATYAVWYHPRTPEQEQPVAVPPAAPAPAAPEPIVRITNFKFTPPALAIAAGTTVTWLGDTGTHSVRCDEEKLDSLPRPPRPPVHRSTKPARRALAVNPMIALRGDHQPPR